jgi:Na+/H+ antiporter NhaD/arsenite permease-like protein
VLGVTGLLFEAMKEEIAKRARRRTKKLFVGLCALLVLVSKLRW